jgi:hypothetical protein
MAVYFFTKLIKKVVVEKYFLKIFIGLSDGVLKGQIRYFYQQWELIMEFQ